MSAILEVRKLTKNFGRFQAVSGVTLTVERKELTSLIGPNGAGKTTFYNMLSGKFPPSSGRIVFEGRDITGLSPHRIARIGIGRSFQITNIFSQMTVMQNILSALIAHHKKGTSFFSPYWKDTGLVAEAEKILDSLGLLPFAHVPTTQLSYGDKRLVEIGIVLANYPRLILLDEPTAGMTPEETDRMIALIHRLAEESDTTFFLTEHDMKVVFSVSQKIYVLHQGRLLAEGTPEEIRENPQVQEAYLGGSIDAEA